MIVIECTFLLPDHKQQAEQSDHTHWLHLEEIVKSNPDVTFVLIHFSLRYKNDEILKFFNDKPKNVIPWI